jgi:anion-transporting  ArsA/GET3 family ATPase
VSQPAPGLLDRRLLFFTGKGGVGKSTMAAATALLAADVGKRVLLVEVDAKGDVPAQFEQSPVGFKPREIYPGVLAMAMDTEASLQEYLRLNLRVPVLGRLGPLARVLDFVATVAPGVKEILTIGKIAWEVREAIEGRADHDLVVVDAAATGHIVAQLGAADAIRDLVDVGPLRNQTQWVSEILADPQVTAVNIVTTPEEMPVAETIELVQRLRSEVQVPLGSVIVNRVLPELFTRTDEETFEALRVPPAREQLTARVGPGATQVLDAARLAVLLRRTRAVHLAHLREEVDLPLLYVPYLFVRAHGLRVTRMVAEALGQELGL